MIATASLGAPAGPGLLPAPTAESAAPALRRSVGHALRRILVATDGSAMADAAFGAAAALAARSGASVEVLTVLPPVMAVAPEIGFVGDLPFAAMERDRRETLLAEVRQQMRTASADALGWPIELQAGHPAATITRVAHDRRIDLVVQGIGLHRPIDRVFGHETVLQVVRLTDAAVLAVCPPFVTLPRRAMVALDFSRSSIEAARRTLDVVAAGARVTLVHVDPHTEVASAQEQADEEIYTRGLDGLFGRLLSELVPPPGVVLETAVLRGERMRELLAFADRERVDLIAVGNHGHSFFERMLMGSVVMKVVRSARCSVLITPPEPARGLGPAGSRSI